MTTASDGTPAGRRSRAGRGRCERRQQPDSAATAGTRTTSRALIGGRSLSAAARSRSMSPAQPVDARGRRRAPRTTSAAAMVMTNRVSTLPAPSGPRRGGDRDEQQVGRVEDELDADQHEHRVAPGQHAVGAQPGEDGGEQVGPGRWIMRALRLAGRRSASAADRAPLRRSPGDGGDQRDEQQQRQDLERPHPGAEELLPRPWVSVVAALDRPAAERQEEPRRAGR